MDDRMDSHLDSLVDDEAVGDETAFARAEESVDKATISAIKFSNDISRDIREFQWSISNLHSAIIDHLDIKIEASIAGELHKNRVKNYEIAKSVLNENSILKSIGERNAEVLTDYLNRLERQNQESEKQLGIKEKRVEDTVEDISIYQKEMQLLCERFDEHLDNERSAKIELRRTQKHFNKVSRERDQAYLDRTAANLLQEEVATQETVVYQKSTSWKIIILILAFLLLLTLVHLAIGLPNLTITIDTSLAVLGVVAQMVATAIANLNWPKIRSRIKSWCPWRIHSESSYE